MKILIVTQYFWPESFRINDVALGLVERGQEVTVLSGTPNYPEGSFFPGYGTFMRANEYYRGVHIIRMPLVPRGQGQGWRLVLNFVSFAVIASILAPFRCREKFDAIFVFQMSPFTLGLPAIVLRKLRGIPVIWWVQDLWPESLTSVDAIRSTTLLHLMNRMVRFVYRRCDRVLVQSRGFVGPVEARGARSADVLYFPNWAEALYKPVKLEENAPERHEVPDGFRVMFAGNIGAAQGFETILAAAEELKGYPDIHWVVVGDGRRRKWVEERVARLGLRDRVHLLGKRPTARMPRYFALADALLVSLKREHIFSLTIPSKVQSYLACGRPVIAALDGEGARIVEEAGCGVTAPAEDAKALAAAVLDLYRARPKEREEMGRRARAYFEEHFEREKLLDVLEGWMEDLVGGKK